jgi:hypothetical protein
VSVGVVVAVCLGATATEPLEGVSTTSVGVSGLDFGGLPGFLLPTLRDLLISLRGGIVLLLLLILIGLPVTQTVWIDVVCLAMIEVAIHSLFLGFLRLNHS